MSTFQAAFYRGTHSGLPGVYNILTRWWTRSKYSHVELIFSTGRAASSSAMDGGVRTKLIDFTADKWDFVDLPAGLEQGARAWFDQHRGEKYDLLGNLHFVLAPVGDDKQKWFCSEAAAAAIGIPDPARFDPGTLYAALTFLTQPASAGFFTPTAQGS